MGGAVGGRGLLALWGRKPLALRGSGWWVACMLSVDVAAPSGFTPPPWPRSPASAASSSSARDDSALAAWYQQHLGMQLEPWGGAILRWPDDKAEDKGVTVWHVAAKDSDWFSPSESTFMINYRVDNLDELLAQLRAAGVEVVKGPESHENGKFAWILDPDGNKVELWEPMLWDDKNKQR